MLAFGEQLERTGRSRPRPAAFADRVGRETSVIIEGWNRVSARMLTSPRGRCYGIVHLPRRIGFGAGLVA